MWQSSLAVCLDDYFVVAVFQNLKLEVILGCAVVFGVVLVCTADVLVDADSGVVVLIDAIGIG